MRKARRALSERERIRLARAMTRRLASLGLLRSGQRIALFVAAGGEMPIDPLLQLAARRGCRLYLPRITSYRASRMTFAPLRPPMRTNRYGIPEPAALRGSLSARWLDLIILPLVAFDATGTRLGSGTGYYDRALSYRSLRKSWRRPRLVGIAYDFQRVDTLERKPWDIPLGLIVTERTIYRTRA
jgi:5-formyltetrahydrofolate cyclo-ligase